MDKLEIMDGPDNFSELTEITNMIDFYRFRNTMQQPTSSDDEQEQDSMEELAELWLDSTKETIH